MDSATNLKMEECDDKAGYEPKFLKIKKELQRVIADVGSTAVFEIMAEGGPLPVYSWYKDGILLETDQRINITTTNVNTPDAKNKKQILKIQNVEESDHGLYSVVCNNTYKQLISQANLFVVKTKLTEGAMYTTCDRDDVGVLRHLRNVNIEEGNRIILEVVFRQTPTRVFWFRNNKVIRKTERNTISVEGTSTSLVVLSSAMTDTGIYYVVGITSEGIVQSSCADVLIAPVNKSEFKGLTSAPAIVELPSKANVFQGDIIRVICKAEIDINTEIKWVKDNVPLPENGTILMEDFGNQYIGLSGRNVTTRDTGDYTLTLQDRVTGRKDMANLYAVVRPKDDNDVVPVAPCERPLRTAVACVGAKLVLDCSFAHGDETDFYVVWYVGPYKVERTNSKFSVIYKGGEYLLYIKKLEPEMAGTVVCELRRALHTQKTVSVNSTTASLTIVPCAMIEQELQNPYLEIRKIFDKECPCKMRQTSLLGSTESDRAFDDTDYLDISYSRLDDDGVFYLHASKRNQLVKISCQDKPWSNSPVILWNENVFPNKSWFVISVGQSDGSYVEVCKSRTRVIKTPRPPLDTIVKIRVRAMPLDRKDKTGMALISIVPPDEAVLVKLLKNDKLQMMKHYKTNYIETGELLGYGSYGSVVLARDRANKTYAVKRMKLYTYDRRKKAQSEYEILKSLHHPQLVRLVEAFSNEIDFVIVMEHLSGGELFDRISEEEHITEMDVVKYTKQICEALDYLHDRRIVHLDLKPENIVCLSPNSCHLKLIDFGLATVLDGLTKRVFNGTRDYMAPELLNYCDVTLACDMWSVGVITYMMLSGQSPFEAHTWNHSATKILSADYDFNDATFNNVSWMAKDFINRLLILDVNTRMTVKKALQHDWLKRGPPNKDQSENMKKAQENMKSYFLAYRAKWQKAGNAVIAAHRLRTFAAVAREIREEQGAQQPSSSNTAFNDESA